MTTPELVNNKDKKTQEESTEETLSFEEIMKQNEKKKAEMAKKRAEANKAVLRSYRIK